MNTKLKMLVVFVLLIGAGVAIYMLMFGDKAVSIFQQPTLTPKPMPSPTPKPTSKPRPAPICSEMKDAKDVPMCLVPAGEFIMGNDNVHKLNTNFGDQAPARTVSVDAFYIDKYEVTNALYKNCVDAGGCSLPGDVVKYNDAKYANHPVVYVGWDQATAYCAWRGVRLPGEAEWEKAARGSKGEIYPWGDDDPDKDLANYGQNVGDTTAVGSYERGRSPFGVYDMGGNVWEWVQDWYAPYPGNTESSPDYGTRYRVLRGGSWYYEGSYMFASFRNWGHSDAKREFYGFRCARSAASQ